MLEIDGCLLNIVDTVDAKDLPEAMSLYSPFHPRHSIFTCSRPDKQPRTHGENSAWTAH